MHKAGASGCDALALPEDTLGTLQWEMGNKTALREVLPEAVRRMLERLGRAAAAHRMYLVCCNDLAEQDGSYRNVAFFLNRQGKEVGRYAKVHPTISESDRVRGTEFPVFETRDLGGVGLSICHDAKFPEASRALALGGADIIFLPSLGGAVMGGDPDAESDLDRAAFRIRAVDNFVYLVVSKRGGGALIISPQGSVLAEGNGANDIAMADIDPFGGRAAGDALDFQPDMRARLFRERNPAAYGILSDWEPPVFKKAPATTTIEDAVRVAEKLLTVGEERYQRAEGMLRSGKNREAFSAFEALRVEFPRTWIERAAKRRLSEIRAAERRDH